MIDNKNRDRDYSNKIYSLESKLKAANVKELLLKTKIVTAKNKPTGSETDDEIIELDDDDKITTTTTTTTSSSVPATNNFTSNTTENNSLVSSLDHDEAKIIALVSTFLVVHPFGASSDYIISYLQRVAPRLRPKMLDEILLRHGALFQEHITGVGAKIERKWKFCGFDTKSID